MIRRPPRYTPQQSSAASDVYKRQMQIYILIYARLSRELLTTLGSVQRKRPFWQFWFCAEKENFWQQWILCRGRELSDNCGFCAEEKNCLTTVGFVQRKRSVWQLWVLCRGKELSDNCGFCAEGTYFLCLPYPTWGRLELQCTRQRRYSITNLSPSCSWQVPWWYRVTRAP